MKPLRLLQGMGVAFAASLAAGALAEPAPVEPCHLHRELSIERLLRRLSIDLRGTVPDVADYDAVLGKTAIPEDILDGYLASDNFRLQMRRHHEDLLWTNPSTQLSDVGFSLSSTNLGNGVTVFHVNSTTKRKLFRGGDGSHVCQDKPQAALGYTAGVPNTEPMGTDPVGPFVAEGWVDVLPYWESDPAKTIKVCAFDAQIAETYTLPAGDPDAGTYTCDHVLAVAKAKGCGCGPSLSYCMLTTVVQPVVLSSMREQLLRLVDDATGGTRPYSELLTTKRAWMNGPLTHYFQYLGQRQSFTRTQNAHTPSDGPLPANLPYTAVDTWVEIEREEPHSGILTLPAYLLRFQTNRGRANRYRISFEGQYFQPPSTDDTGCAAEGDDLTLRCVCRSCHVTLEPLAAHFGQFSEAGTTSLRDFTPSFTTHNLCAKGIAPASNGWCDRFYGPKPTQANPNVNTYDLKPLRYADPDHPDVQPHYDGGPGMLVQQDIASGLFHQVATRKMFELLMKREAQLDPTSPGYEGDLLDSIAVEFAGHDNLKLLVKQLVELPMYRRMP